jgi:hypothetical protein
MSPNQDRRQVESRRVSLSTEVTKDQRSDGRRKSDDRRGKHVNIDKDSENFLFEMCKWFNSSCKGAWQIGPNESEPGNSPVSCRVRFEDEADQTAFNSWVDGWESS